MKCTAPSAIALVLILTGCSGSRHSSTIAATTTTTSTPSTTIVTRRAAPARPCSRTLSAVPIDRVPAGVYHGEPVVGSGALWTIAASLRLHGMHQARGWVIKMPWITRPFGIPLISARRLDGPGTFRATADEAIDQTGKWVASNLIFSTAGCWEVTSRFRTSTLRFQIRIG